MLTHLFILFFITLTASGSTQDLYIEQMHHRIAEQTETLPVNFTYFNNPFALETFDNPEIYAKCTGFVQYGIWWANRQSVDSRNVTELMFGARPLYDPDCRDINSEGESDMLVLDTRIRAELFGPKIGNVKTFGFIEADIFGEFETDTAIIFRIWHAFLRLSWPKHKLLIGQFWHPFSVVETFPPTITLDYGSPITPNSRNPQISYTYTNGRKEIMFSLMAQQQFVNDGPIGPSTLYLRNASLPIVVARGIYNDKEYVYAGWAAAFERIKPRLESNRGYKVHEAVNSFKATVFATITFEPLEVRQQLTYGQNATDLTMLGGYAVTSYNAATDERTYTNLNTITYWIDINIDKKTEPGVFMGIAKNLGARKPIIQCITDPKTGAQETTVYSPEPDVDSVFKCYPRIRFHTLPIEFALELQYSRATYGCLDEQARVKRLDPTHHLRMLFVSYFFF